MQDDHHYKPSSELDFETGDQFNDEFSDWRNAQAQLYTIDNPYVGSKRKIIVDIADALQKAGVEYNSVLDLFSGSSVAGLFWKIIGKQVFSNDILTSSYYNAVSFVENSHIIITPEEIEHLCFNNNPDKKDFVQKNYQNRFTPKEAEFLDNFRANVESHYPDNLSKEDNEFIKIHNQIQKIKKAICITTIEHYILNHCFLGGRLNNGQVLSKLNHRVGHARNKGYDMQFNLKPLSLFQSEKPNRAYNEDAATFLDTFLTVAPVDLVYIDPPYGGEQSDYASMYAFCEEYIYGDKIDNLPHIKNAKKFSGKKAYEEHFKAILSRCHQFKSWAISYNETSWSSLEAIKSIVGSYKGSVKAINIDHEYRYRKERGKATEYLIIATD